MKKLAVIASEAIYYNQAKGIATDYSLWSLNTCCFASLAMTIFAGFSHYKQIRNYCIGYEFSLAGEGKFVIFK